MTTFLNQTFSAGLYAEPIDKAFAMTPCEFGAKGDFSQDDGPALNEAIRAAANEPHCKAVIIPCGDYRIDTSIQILDGVAILSQGATLATTSGNISVLSADGVKDWTIDGTMRIVGTRKKDQPNDRYSQNGLSIKDSTGFRVSGIRAQSLEGLGFHLFGEKALTRGDGRQFDMCSAYGCRNGRRIDAGAGGEYSSWTNWHATANAVADSIQAGNTHTGQGVIAHNQVGIELRDGPNDGHGIYSGVAINHNFEIGVDATDVLNGYTFSGCHLYQNLVRLTRCTGIFFRSGIFDCPVINDGSSESGLNGVSECFLPGAYSPEPKASVTNSDNGSGREKFIFATSCSGPGSR